MRENRDKKDFICRVCKQKFQSSFDLNVHTLEGCECSAVQKHELSTVLTDANRQVTQEKGTERMNETKETEGIVNQILVSKAKQHLKCKYCTKHFMHILPYRNHVHTCRLVMTMSNINDIQRKNRLKPT